jgi:nitric oxide reductase activation protein
MPDILEKPALQGVAATLAQKLGDAQPLVAAAGSLDGLLDEAGLRNFFQVADFLATTDRPTALWLLKHARSVLAPLPDAAGRTEVLALLLAMGRSRWIVVGAALQRLPGLAASPGLAGAWLRSAAAIADIDQDVALQYLDASLPVLEAIGPERFAEWADLGEQIARISWKSAREYFKSSPEVFKRIDGADLGRWARLGLHLLVNSPRQKAHDAHSMLAIGAAAGKSKMIDLALQYFKTAPQILARLSMNDLEEWVTRGLVASGEHKDRGTAYFSLQTGSSRSAVEGLVKGLELKDVHAVLRSYAEALAGKKLMLRSSSIFYKNLPGLSRFFSVTDGERIFLPSRIEAFADDELNFMTYKWILTHELGHLLYGTFDVDERELARAATAGSRSLALRVFEFLEDERVDHLLGLAYPGLEKDRRTLLQAHLAQRGAASAPSLFEALSLGLPEAEIDAADPAGGALAAQLRAARAEAVRPGCAARDVLGIALSVAAAAGEGAHRQPGAAPASFDRLFYRGIIDFDLVAGARAGTARLIDDMAERLASKKVDVPRETVAAAVRSLEETAIVDSEELLWQVDDGDRLAELFEQVQAVIAEMEAEKRLRRSVYYDEWDQSLGDYRKDWCRVREMDMPETSPAVYQKALDENYGLVSLLRRHFGLLRPDRIKRFFREERGDDIDLDAVIEALVERHAGITPSDRIYIRREKNLRDVSVAFLLDMSYSTGDVLASGKRIIDIEREGMVLMAEALESIGDSWAVFGFSSNYRDKVDFHVVHDFDEPFGAAAKSRFAGIVPMAQTRLGAAIRHANRLLARRPSRIRLLILLSDGRPYDIDYGDADYGVEDTRRALLEGRRKGVNSFCITVDKKSRDYLPHMYGEANYTVIDNVETLPARLPLIYKRLTT